MPELMHPVAPGGTVGILGGGQLGRMLCLAAARLGLKCVVFAPDTHSPAFQVSAAHVIGAYDDRTALQRFAAQVDVITYEFENIPADTGAFLSSLKPVRPNPQALSTIQNRIAEKAFIQKQGIGTAPFAAVTSEESAREAFAAIGAPAVLKTSRLGYDGKGQRMVRSLDEIVAAWSEFGRVECILEGFVDFTRELSVVAARAANGAIECYDLVENIHGDHILRTTLAPAKARQHMKEEANSIASRLLQAFGYVGVMAVELFEAKDGRLLVNEIAPRVHNSGHWTIDACATSQFEQHIRAVAGWPLGVSMRHSDAVMTNLLGNEADAWASYAATGGPCIHLYGKTDARQGRKMGHVTRLYPINARPDPLRAHIGHRFLLNEGDGDPAFIHTAKTLRLTSADWFPGHVRRGEALLFQIEDGEFRGEYVALTSRTQGDVVTALQQFGHASVVVHRIVNPTATFDGGEDDAPAIGMSTIQRVKR